MGRDDAAETAVREDGGLLGRFTRWSEDLIRRRAAPFERVATPPPDRLFPFLRWALSRLRGLLVALAATAAVVGATEALLILGVGALVDRAAASGAGAFWSENAWFLIGLAAVAFVVRPAAMALQSLLGSVAAAPNASIGTIWRLHRHSLRQSLRFFEDDFAGRLAQKQMQSGMAMASLSIDVTTSLGLVLSFFAATTVALGATDWRLGLIAAAWGVGYALILRAMLPRVRRAARERAERRAAATGVVVDSFTNVKTVKLFAHSDVEERAAERALSGYHASMMIFGWRVTALRALLALLNAALTGGMIATALLLWTNGATSLGVVAAAGMLTIRLAAISNWIAFTLLGIFTEIGTIEDAIGSLAKEPDVRDRPTAAAPDAAADGAPPEIVFDDVSFRYPAGGPAPRADAPAALHGISLTIAPGEKVGVVGPSGAGKSTLISLLLRLYDVDGGAVRVGGRDVRDWPQDALRARIAVIAQEAALFNRSARENIRYGRPDADDDDVLAASETAAAARFIADLRDGRGRAGYDAHLGERGVRLSGGQRQRIALARVVLKGAPILIFDEATSALDSEVEAEILAALEPVMAGRTVLAIAHRLSTLQAMDRIVVLDGGRLVEDGTHERLIAECGVYARLWARQSGGVRALGGSAAAAE